MQVEMNSSGNKTQRVEVQVKDEEAEIALKNSQQQQQTQQSQQTIQQTQYKTTPSTYLNNDQTIAQKYENVQGLISFNVSEAVIGRSCCCCKKKVGAPYFASFQNKVDEQRNKPFTRIQILINPTSGGGNGKKIGLNVIKQLQKLKIPYIAVYSVSILHFYDFVETFDFEGEDLLMICGGDGSIFMTLNILAKRQAIEKKLNEKPVKPYPIAVIPGGTGNDFCSSLGFNHIQVSSYVEKYLINPQVRKIDIGRCRIKNENGVWKTYNFSCQGGIGFAGRADIRAKKMGYFFRLKYKVAAFIELLSAKTDIMTVIADGQTILDKGKVKFIEINNVPRTGGGFRACPIAQVNDSLLDCIIMYSDKLKKMLDCLQNAEKDGLHIYDQECKYLRAREIKIICHDSKPLDMELDGEDFQCTEAIFDIDSQLVEVVY